MGEIRCSYIRPKIPRDPKVESCWSSFSKTFFTTEFTAALESVNCIHCKSVRLCWYQSSLSGKQDGECSICYNWLSVGIVMESKLEDMVTGAGFENVQLCGFLRQRLYRVNCGGDADRATSTPRSIYMRGKNNN